MIKRTENRRQGPFVFDAQTLNCGDLLCTHAVTLMVVDPFFFFLSTSNL